MERPTDKSRRIVRRIISATVDDAIEIIAETGPLTTDELFKQVTGYKPNPANMAGRFVRSNWYEYTNELARSKYVFRDYTINGEIHYNFKWNIR